MKPILSLLVSVLFFSAIQAEPLDERRKLAFELVEILAVNVPNDLDFKQALTAQIDGAIPQLNLGAKDSALFREAAMDVAVSITAERLIEMVAMAYAKRLSAKELEDVIAFYKSDSGKAWLREQSAIEAEKVAQKKAAIAEFIEDVKLRFQDLKKQNPE